MIMKIFIAKIIPILLVAVCSFSGCSDAQNTTSGLNAELMSAQELVTFIELGSKKCIPCKMMQPVMDSIEKSYAG